MQIKSAPTPLKYRAFLSYAHADVRWGRWLHSHLENFRIDKDLVGRVTARGPVPKSLRPVFRDREDFSGGHSLTDATIAALDQAEALVVLCSRVSATRPAVNEEVRLFRSRHPNRPVIPVLIDGTIPENFPPALRFEIAADGSVTDRQVTILGPDLRDDADGKSLGLAKIVAGLTGLAADDIYRRAERARRQAQWQRRRNYAAVALLLAASGSAAATYGRWIVHADSLVYKAANWSLDTARPGLEFQDCSSCPAMVVLPKGRYVMGSPDDESDRESDEGPQHPVVIPRPIAVSKYPITFDQWDTCFVAAGCTEKAGDEGWGRGMRPVINISWSDARQYVLWLSSVTGRHYRLLSEAEWEYAARSGTTTRFWWGDEIGTGNAACRECGSQWDFHQTAPVGSFKPNSFGLYDVHGNVFQWVEDCYHRSYAGAPTDGSAWLTECADNERRMVRGGSWDGVRWVVRSAYRFRNAPTLGFRIAREVDGTTEVAISSAPVVVPPSLPVREALLSAGQLATPARRFWLAPAHEFVLRHDGTWVELQAGTKTFTFETVEDSQSELVILDRTRDLYLRVVYKENQSYWRRGPSGSWNYFLGLYRVVDDRKSPDISGK